MNVEHRDLRPFDDIPEISDFVDGVRLAVGDRIAGSGSSVVVPREDFLRSPVELLLAESDEEFNAKCSSVVAAVKASVYELDQLALAVVLTSPFLKQTHLSLLIPLGSLAASGRRLPLTSGDRPRPFRSPRSGCRVELYVCLSEQRERAPLQAWRRWTWLASTTFTVGTGDDLSGFVPRSLGADQRKELGLPKGTLRFVTLGGVSPLDPGTSAESLDVWVDEDVLAAMSASSSTPASIAFQLVLFVDAVAAVVNAAHQDGRLEGLTFEDVGDTLFGQVVKIVAGNQASEGLLNSLVGLAADDPAVFVAHVEAMASVLSATNKLIGAEQ
jgi:hypothetical protein